MEIIKRIIHWSLFTVAIIYVLTGLGITEYRIVEPLTFGLLTKTLAFTIHNNLLIPFLVLLTSHICFAFILKNNKNPR
jgi:cytochrome b subunit of formate dehydrogenase